MDGFAMLIHDHRFGIGTAVEHHALYQYQLASTKNIFMGQIQSETPCTSTVGKFSNALLRIPMLTMMIHFPGYHCLCGGLSVCMCVCVSPRSRLEE